MIRAYNLLQFIHQVTIEIRFQKSLAQERFKSNLEFRNQIIVASITFRKGFAKFMIPKAIRVKLPTLSSLKRVCMRTKIGVYIRACER